MVPGAEGGRSSVGDRQGACGNCEAQLRVGAEEERQEEGKKGREGGEAFPSPLIFGGHITNCLIVSQTRPVPVAPAALGSACPPRILAIPS